MLFDAASPAQSELPSDSTVDITLLASRMSTVYSFAAQQAQPDLKFTRQRRESTAGIYDDT